MESTVLWLLWCLISLEVAGSDVVAFWVMSTYKMVEQDDEPILEAKNVCIEFLCPL
jgi:hypothetical protein